MKNLRICVVITCKTLQELLSNFKKLQKLTNFIEIRIDYIKNITYDKLEKIFEIKKNITEVIITCRSVEHGGEFKGNSLEQEKILQVSNDLGFEYLDIDIKLIDKINIKNKKCKIICSYHDFESTPNYQELSDIIDYMREFDQVDICKTATMVKDKDDNKVIYKIIKEKKELTDVIILGMGKEGAETRTKGLVKGNYLTFASHGNNSSASGQMDIKKMKELLEVWYNKLN